MSLLDPAPFRVQTDEEAQYRAATQPTGFGEYLGAKLKSGFDSSLAGRAYEALTEPSAAGTPTVYGKGGYRPAAPNPSVLSEDEYKASTFWRDGLDYTTGLTTDLARARADAFDERRYRDSLIARYQGGVASYVAGFAAQVVGGALSPENFIPFIGPEIRAAMVARMGLIGGHVAAGIGDAAIGTALTDAAVFTDLNRRGEDLGAADFALDLTLGAVAGGLFGLGAGIFAKPEAMRRVASDVRVDGLQRQADALELATSSLARDEPVDVGRVLESDSRLMERARPEDVVVMGPTPVPRSREAGAPAVREQAAGAAAPESRAAPASPDRAPAAPQIDAGWPMEKPFLAFDHGDLDRLVADIRGFAQREATRYFGGDEGRAKRYLQLTKQEDSSSPDVAAAASAALDAEYGGRIAALEDRLDSGPPHSIKDLQPLREALSDAAGFPAASDEEIAQSIGWGLRKASKGEMERAMRGDINDPKVAAGIILSRSGLQELARRGLPREKVNEMVLRETAGSSGLEPADVAYLLREFIQAGRAGTGGAPAGHRPNLSAIEPPVPPHPSVVEAEAVMKQAPPKDAVAAVDRLAADMGVTLGAPAEKAPGARQAADIPELDDIAVMRRDGLLTEADERALAEADDLVKEADGWADAYAILTSCVLRSAA